MTLAALSKPLRALARMLSLSERMARTALPAAASMSSPVARRRSAASTRWRTRSSRIAAMLSGSSWSTMACRSSGSSPFMAASWSRMASQRTAGVGVAIPAAVRSAVRALIVVVAGMFMVSPRGR
ncbi:hypothetical protein ASD90_15035 [Terrabacter sp. Root181]|nr:hypothetical protein ASD90_15035 [Terrabacter sp. Root181]